MKIEIIFSGSLLVCLFIIFINIIFFGISFAFRIRVVYFWNLVLSMWNCLYYVSYIISLFNYFSHHIFRFDAHVFLKRSNWILFILLVCLYNEHFSQDYYEVYNESSKLQISSERWSLQTWNSVYWGLLVDAPSISLSRVAPVYLPYIWGLNNETIKKGRLNPSKLNIRDRLSDTSFEDSVLKVRYFDESFSQKSFTSSNILVNVT